MTGSEGLRAGVVYGTGGGIYRIRLDDGSFVDASLRGRLKQEARAGSRVVVGDEVEVASSSPDRTGDPDWVIERVSRRRSRIVRRSGPGRHPKIVAANIDRLVVVVAAAEPDPRREVIDRLLVLAESDHVPVLLVITKIDLPTARERAASLAAVYRGAGYDVVESSVETGEGLEEIRAGIREGTSALVGPSGVGKSTLLNALEPSLDLRTGELSRKLRRGRHTTVSSRLIDLPGGGRVADTPGFAEVGVWGVDAAEMDTCFPEFRALRDDCRFRGCTHLHEPGCAVIEAVESGAVDPERHEVYALLRDEAAMDAARGRGAG